MVRWTYSGIRPLYDDGASKAQEATREYVLKLEAPDGQPPLLSGLWRQDHHLPQARRSGARQDFPLLSRPQAAQWTAGAALLAATFLMRKLNSGSPISSGAMRFSTLRMPAASSGPMARGPTGFSTACVRCRIWAKASVSLSAREVDYLMKEEWAETPEDILWRRSKLGLHLSVAEQSALQAYLNKEAGEKDPPESFGSLTSLRTARKANAIFRNVPTDFYRTCVRSGLGLSRARNGGLTMSLLKTVSAAALLLALGAAPAFADVEARRNGRRANSADDAFQGRPAERARMFVKRRNRSRAWKSTCCRKPFRRMNMNRRR